MPLDATVGLTTHDHVEAQARAFACRLDVLLGLQDERVEDALLAIGELLGGLSVFGFSYDLSSHLRRVEQDQLEDAGPWDYSPGLGPNDPDARFSAALQDRIAEMRATDARDWMDEATALLDAAMVRS